MNIENKVGQNNEGEINSKKVLIIDDSFDKRLFIGEVLRERGYEVYEAYDRKDGLNKFVPDTYSVVVCDQEMPEMFGEKVIPLIKEKSPNQPVIMFSTKVDRFNEEKKKKIGADEYIDLNYRGNMFTRLVEAVQRLDKKF
jgi:DNA-binding response OmpR family regulator